MSGHEDEGSDAEKSVMKTERKKKKVNKQNKNGIICLIINDSVLVRDG